MTRINEVLQDVEVTSWQGDLALIYESWLKSLIGSTPFLKGVPARLCYRQHRKVIDRLLKTSDVITLTLKDDPDFIIGYVVASSYGSIGIVHYIYVKKIYQSIGVAALLLKHVRDNYHQNHHLPMIATHSTDKGNERLKGFGLVYNPYLLISGDDAHETQITQAG